MRNKLFELLMYAYALNDDSTAEDHANVGTVVEAIVRRDKLMREALIQITCEGPARAVWIAQQALGKALTKEK